MQTGVIFDSHFFGPFVAGNDVEVAWRAGGKTWKEA